MTRPPSRHSFGRIWRWPLVLAVLIVFGLVSALLGQGSIWWALSWIALTIPLGVVAACVYLRGDAASPHS